MKKTACILSIFITCSAGATWLDLNSTTLDLNGITANSETYSTALSVEANTGGDVLVIGTFSAKSIGKTSAGNWQLSSGDQTSTAITGTIDGKKDINIASVVHIFTGITAGDSIYLEHRKTGKEAFATSGANLVAIPLTTSTGEQLNHGIYQQTAGFQTASTTLVDTGIKTSVQLDRASNNGVYMAASFNAQAISGAETGIWQLQYRKVGDATWIDTGSAMIHDMSLVSSVGTVTLYALEEDLPPGEYEVQLAVKSASGETVETLNGTLAAVALSYTNDGDGGYFEGFSLESDSLSPVDGPYDGIQTTLSLSSMTNGVFSSMSFGSSADLGVDQTSGFSLLLTNNAATYSNQENQRYFKDITDAGSGATVGYFSGLDAGEYTLFGVSSNLTAPIATSAVTMVGFSTEAIPEPAVITLIGTFGGMLLISRRIFKKSSSDSSH